VAILLAGNTGLVWWMIKLSKESTVSGKRMVTIDGSEPVQTSATIDHIQLGGDAFPTTASAAQDVYERLKDFTITAEDESSITSHTVASWHWSADPLHTMLYTARGAQFKLTPDGILEPLVLPDLPESYVDEDGAGGVRQLKQGRKLGACRCTSSQRNCQERGSMGNTCPWSGSCCKGGGGGSRR